MNGDVDCLPDDMGCVSCPPKVGRDYYIDVHANKVCGCLMRFGDAFIRKGNISPTAYAIFGKVGLVVKLSGPMADYINGLSNHYNSPAEGRYFAERLRRGRGPVFC